MAQYPVHVRRVYDKAVSEDGARILVDRIWPRGLRKESAQLDDWLKEVAPSTELRKWYGHDPTKFDEFRHRYQKELDDAQAYAALQRLRGWADQKKVTLLTASRDVEHSQAVVLQEML